MRIRIPLTVMLALAPFAVGRAQQPIDWDALHREGVQVMTDYLKINTANPPGNELEGALFLKKILEREGIEVQLLDTAELRARRGANLYARLRGNGSKTSHRAGPSHRRRSRGRALLERRPVLRRDPDGFLYGRGALDMKGEGIIHLMAMIALKRSGVPLNARHRLHRQRR